VSNEKVKWYLYHEVNGKLVLDVADHTDHHRQALAAAGMPKPKYVLGTMEEQTLEQLAPYAKQKGLTVDLTPRPALTPFVEPEHWKRIRESNEAHRAAKKGAVK
jgi:hypothetical protein